VRRIRTTPAAPQEIVALTQRQVEALPGQRHEIEPAESAPPGWQCRNRRGRAHRLGDIGPVGQAASPRSCSNTMPPCASSARRRAGRRRHRAQCHARVRGGGLSRCRRASADCPERPAGPVRGGQRSASHDVMQTGRVRHRSALALSSSPPSIRVQMDRRGHHLAAGETAKPASAALRQRRQP